MGQQRKKAAKQLSSFSILRKPWRYKLTQMTWVNVGIVPKVCYTFYE